MAGILDSYPVFMTFVVFAVVMLVVFEVGFRVGRWWQDRVPGEQEGPTDMLVGSLLALMAFVLAITMGMAADRFDGRRGMVVAEANAIGAAYLQSDYLPDPQADQVKELLRQYIQLRIVPEGAGREDLVDDVARSLALQQEMWAIHRDVARSGHSPDLMSTLGSAITEIVSIGESRIVAGLYARVPETIMILLLGGSALALGMVGYSAGLKGHRSVLSAVVLVVALGAVTVLVVDLDKPQEGFIRVSQQALVDVQRWMGPPTP